VTRDPTSPPDRDPEARVSDAVELLQSLWGEELPPAPDAWRTVASDAVAVDDERGTRQGLVVQGDGLRHVTLAALVRAAGPRAPVLPLRLARLLQDVPSVASVAADSVAEARCEDVGLWTYDFASRTVMFDEACGVLLGEGSVAIGDRSLTAALTTTIHPDDRERVAEALLSADAPGLGYDVAFRSRHPDGSWVSLRGRGRVISPGAQGARLVGALSREPVPSAVA
jgi:PAS domain-containing protein